VSDTAQPMLGDHDQVGIHPEKDALLMTPQPRDWQHLAEQASIEMDPSKLVALVTELNRVLRERDEKSIQLRH